MLVVFRAKSRQLNTSSSNTGQNSYTLNSIFNLFFHIQHILLRNVLPVLQGNNRWEFNSRAQKAALSKALAAPSASQVEGKTKLLSCPALHVPHRCLRQTCRVHGASSRTPTLRQLRPGPQTPSPPPDTRLAPQLRHSTQFHCSSQTKVHLPQTPIPACRCSPGQALGCQQRVPLPHITATAPSSPSHP